MDSTPDMIFERFDPVIISGTYTGIGDVTGRIFDYQYSTLEETWKYDIRDGDGNTWFVAERFLAKCETRIKPGTARGDMPMTLKKL